MFQLLVKDKWENTTLAQFLKWAKWFGTSDEGIELAVLEMIQHEVTIQVGDRNYRFVDNP